MMQPSDLRQEVAAVFGEIVAAKRLVRAGRTVGLEDLDKRIGVLCEAVVLLPREDGQAMLPLLEDLTTSLDDLADALKTASSGDRDASQP
jgi:hypothetical protein